MRALLTGREISMKFLLPLNPRDFEHRSSEIQAASTVVTFTRDYQPLGVEARATRRIADKRVRQFSRRE